MRPPVLQKMERFIDRSGESGSCFWRDLKDENCTILRVHCYDNSRVLRYKIVQKLARKRVRMVDMSSDEFEFFITKKWDRCFEMRRLRLLPISSENDLLLIDMRQHGSYVRLSTQCQRRIIRYGKQIVEDLRCLKPYLNQMPNPGDLVSIDEPHVLKRLILGVAHKLCNEFCRHTTQQVLNIPQVTKLLTAGLILTMLNTSLYTAHVDVLNNVLMEMKEDIIKSLEHVGCFIGFDLLRHHRVNIDGEVYRERLKSMFHQRIDC